MPIRQAYLNGLIPSRQRATILSFDSMMSSTGGVWAQPVLGRAADVWGYAPSYLLGAGISALALPFLGLSRRQNARRHRGPGRRRGAARLTHTEASHSAGSGGGRTERYGLPTAAHAYQPHGGPARLRGRFCCRRQHRPTESRSAALCDAIATGRFLMKRGKGRA